MSLNLCHIDIHDINIQDIGFISAIPQLCAAVSLIFASFLADFLRNRRILSPSNVSKMCFTLIELKLRTSRVLVQM